MKITCDTYYWKVSVATWISPWLHYSIANHQSYKLKHKVSADCVILNMNGRVTSSKYAWWCSTQWMIQVCREESCCGIIYLLISTLHVFSLWKIENLQRNTTNHFWISSTYVWYYTVISCFVQHEGIVWI